MSAYADFLKQRGKGTGQLVKLAERPEPKPAGAGKKKNNGKKGKKK